MIEDRLEKHFLSWGNFSDEFESSSFSIRTYLDFPFESVSTIATIGLSEFILGQGTLLPPLRQELAMTLPIELDRRSFVSELSGIGEHILEQGKTLGNRIFLPWPPAHCRDP